MPPPPGPEPLLLLHGQPGSARDWEPLLARIGERENVLAFDRPGWDGHTAATDLPGNAAAALAVLDAAGHARATVVGHSFGGGIAAWLAAHHPERVNRLMLVAPSANVASLYRVDRWLASPLVGEVASAATLGSAGAVLRAAPIRRRLAQELSVGDSYLRASAQRLLSRAAWRAYAFEQRALVRDLPVLESRLHRITASTTIVAGTGDFVVPLSSLRELASQIPGAELRLLPRAGHLLTLRHAETLAAIVVRD